MSKKKAGKSSSNGRDSVGKRLGIKKNHHSYVQGGSIIVRQRGSSIHPGLNVKMGRDFTLFSVKIGRVCYYDGFKNRKFVKVIENNVV